MQEKESAQHSLLAVGGVDGRVSLIETATGTFMPSTLNPAYTEARALLTPSYTPAPDVVIYSRMPNTSCPFLHPGRGC